MVMPTSSAGVPAGSPVRWTAASPLESGAVRVATASGRPQDEQNLAVTGLTVPQEQTISSEKAPEPSATSFTDRVSAAGPRRRTGLGPVGSSTPLQ
jgi:hypothetical protein